MRGITVLFTLVFTIIIGVSSLNAQSHNVDMSSDIQQLCEQYISSENNERAHGWSVLVLNSQDRRALDRMIAEIKANYRSYPYEWTFESPYYKVKLGAFRTRLEAKKFSQKIKKDFPSGLEVKAEIKKSDFLKQQLD